MIHCNCYEPKSATVMNRLVFTITSYRIRVNLLGKFLWLFMNEDNIHIFRHHVFIKRTQVIVKRNDKIITCLYSFINPL